MGWHIWQDSNGSQSWKANRFGVRLCARTRELLMMMIVRRSKS